MTELLPLDKVAEGYLEACEELGVDAEELVKLGQTLPAKPTYATIKRMMEEPGGYSPKRYQGMRRTQKLRRTPLPTAPTRAEFHKGYIGPQRQKLYERWRPGEKPAEQPLAVAPAVAAVAAKPAPAEAQPKSDETAAIQAYKRGLRTGAIDPSKPAAPGGWDPMTATDAERSLHRRKEKWRQYYADLKRKQGEPQAKSWAARWLPAMQQSSEELAESERLEPSTNLAEQFARRTMYGVTGAGKTMLLPAEALWGQIKGLGRGIERAVEGPEAIAARQKAEAEAAEVETDVAAVGTKADTAKALRQSTQKAISEFEQETGPWAEARRREVAAGRRPPPLPTTDKDRLDEIQTYNSWKEALEQLMTAEDKGDLAAVAKRYKLPLHPIYERYLWSKKYGRGGRGGRMHSPLSARIARSLRLGDVRGGMRTWGYQ